MSADGTQRLDGTHKTFDPEDFRVPTLSRKQAEAQAVAAQSAVAPTHPYVAVDSLSDSTGSGSQSASSEDESSGCCYSCCAAIGRFFSDYIFSPIARFFRGLFCCNWSSASSPDSTPDSSLVNSPVLSARTVSFDKEGQGGETVPPTSPRTNKNYRSLFPYAQSPGEREELREQIKELATTGKLNIVEDSCKNPILLEIFYKGYCDLIPDALKLGADINAEKTMLKVEKKDAEAEKKNVEKTDTNAEEKIVKKTTLLHALCESTCKPVTVTVGGKKWELIEYLIRHHKPKLDILDHKGRTPFIVACTLETESVHSVMPQSQDRRSQHAALALINSKKLSMSDINKQYKGYTALDWAIVFRLTKVQVALIKLGVKKSPGVKPGIPPEVTVSGPRKAKAKKQPAQDEMKAEIDEDADNGTMIDSHNTDSVDQSFV